MKVVAYMVTAQRRNFRRVGRDFELGVPTKVDATALTTVQAEFLAASNPRDLVVEAIYDAPPVTTSGIGTSPGVPEATPAKRGRGK